MRGFGISGSKAAHEAKQDREKHHGAYSVVVRCIDFAGDFCKQYSDRYTSIAFKLAIVSSDTPKYLSFVAVGVPDGDERDTKGDAYLSPNVPTKRHYS